MYFWKFPKNIITVIVSYQGAPALSWLARVKRLLIIIWILKFSSTWSVYSTNKVQDTSVVLESTHTSSLGGLQYHTGILFSKCTICHPKTSFWVKKTSCGIRIHDRSTSPSPAQQQLYCICCYYTMNVDPIIHLVRCRWMPFLASYIHVHLTTSTNPLVTNRYLSPKPSSPTQTQTPGSSPH